MNNYQIYRVPLTNAGTDDIKVGANYFKLLWAGTLDANGRPAVPALATVVECTVGTSEDDYMPLGINSLISGAATRYRLRWNAQPGIWAFFLITLEDPRSGAITVDAPPTSQIVTQAMGTTLAASAVTVGTAAVQIAAASGTRQKLTVRNNSASAKVYLGADNTLTTANGFVIGPGEGFTFEGSTAAVFAVSDTASTDVRILSEG